MALSTPDIGSQRIEARLFGSTQTAEWSQPGITAASIAFAFLEADPTVLWDAQRLGNVRQGLEALGAYRG